MAKYKLYEHQKAIIEKDPKKCGLFLGTGSAKTLTSLMLAKGKTLVICPKQQRDDNMWHDENKKWETNVDLKVISKEDLRRDWESLPHYDTVVVDECHNNLGVQPAFIQRKRIQYPKTSQIFEATQKFLVKHPPTRLYLLSATPVPKPMSMWAIGTLFGQKWDFRQFREVYYTEIRMGLRRIWIAKKTDEAQTRLANLVQKFGYTGSLEDFFDVPEQTHKVVHLELTAEQKKASTDMSFAEGDALVRRARLRTIANGVLYGKKIESLDEKTDYMTDDTKIFKSKKIDYILERAQEFPKLLIFATYTAQVHEIERCLKKEGYNVSTLTGATKDRTFIKKINKSTKPHIIISNCRISSGYELPTFPCVIYASKEWQYVHYKQSLGRVLRANHLKKNLYIHLVIKGPDEDCHNSIMLGEDFAEKLTLNI